MQFLYFVFLSLFLFGSHDDMPATARSTESLTSSSDQNGPGPLPYQVVISEIMADPEPGILLPEAEFLELYNRTELPVDLTGWRLLVGSRQKILSSYILPGKAYVILCDTSDVSSYASLGAVLGVAGMPALSNPGQTLVLKSPSGMIIHTVTYSDKWYKSSSKSEGGWSLEIIDTENPCGGEGNWSESTDPRGGSPGSANSVRAVNRDNRSPLALRAYPYSSSDVRLKFNESMDSASVSNASEYTVGQGVLHPFAVVPEPPDYSSVLLHFSSGWKNDVIYNLVTGGGLRDCAGNAIDKNNVIGFALPERVDSFDIVISEVLFDRSPGTDEFIELYNRSSKVLDLSSLSLAIADPGDYKYRHILSLSSCKVLIFPGTWLAMTPDDSWLPPETRNLWEKSVIEVPDMFSLPDEQAVITILDKNNRPVDQLAYSNRMHASFITHTEGVSLERILLSGITNDPDNWYSAAGVPYFSTPGYRNSQMISEAAQSEYFRVEPGIFSPDDDGIEDQVFLYYALDDAGYLANIAVFDANGRKIRTLASSMLTGTEGTIIWDGDRDDGQIADRGIYIVYAEFYHAKGQIHYDRKLVTIVRKR